MKIKDKIDINDLDFGVMLQPMNYTKYENKTKLEQHNLFGSSRVLESVARWVLMNDIERKKYDFLKWCFFDVCARVEYEFIVCPWPFKENVTVSDCGVKVDTWTMYVVPNAELLRELVDRVTPTSAERYLKERRKLYR